MITNYIPDTCKYSVNNLKKVVHIFSSASNKVYIDNGEAYVTGGITDLQTISATSVTFEENTSYDDRFKFQKTVTVTVDGFLKLSTLNEKYYVVLEDENSIKWLVNADFPSLVTYTYTLTDGTDETVFTFNTLSNFPTLKLNATINNSTQCKQYNHTKVNELKMLEKKYANINAQSGIIYGYSNRIYKTVKPNEGSIKLEETFDGTNVTTNIQFNINFDDYQSSWHYNLLEYPDNKYVAVIDHLASGFEMGLVPSYSIQGSYEINQGDIVTIKLVGTSQRGSEWAENWTEVTIAPVYEWKLTDEWACSPIEYRWVTVPDAYECSGTTKMTQEKKQMSADSGETWTDVVPLEIRTGDTVIEYNSEDCGYIPPLEGAYRLFLSDGTRVTGDCCPETASTCSLGYYDIGRNYNPVSAEIGDCVDTLYGAFVNCWRLTSITISDSVTQLKCEAVEGIYLGTFYRCYNLTSITLPTGLTTIEETTFYRCSGLTSIDIPSGVTSIGDWTFADCTGLTSVGLQDTLTTIGTHAFENCYSLTGITIPNGVTSIGGYAFYNCRSLTSVTIGNSVTSIYGWAFRNCKKLKSVTIPSSVTSIGTEAFYGCSGLTSITCLALTPPTLNMAENGVFYGTYCPIYVPTVVVNTYKSASGWSYYADKIQAIP